jgi:hypothetical protein
MNLIALASIVHIVLTVNVFFRPRLLFVLVLAFSISFGATAQTEAEKFTATHSVHLELGGNAGRYAFNYGRLIYQKRAFKVLGSVGFSLWSDSNLIKGNTRWYPAIPLELSALIGRGKHHLEIGLGITSFLDQTINFSNDTGTGILTKGSNFMRTIVPLRVGYRYQKPDGGFFFRVGYTPFFGVPDRMNENWYFQPIHAGLGLGVSF